ncbi:MAG TPA: hypothetical protein VGF67_26140 [Ktedonobacteraceae bacterium]
MAVEALLAQEKQRHSTEEAEKQGQTEQRRPAPPQIQRLRPKARLFLLPLLLVVASSVFFYAHSIATPTLHIPPTHVAPSLPQARITPTARATARSGQTPRAVAASNNGNCGSNSDPYASGVPCNLLLLDPLTSRRFWSSTFDEVCRGYVSGNGRSSYEIDVRTPGILRACVESNVTAQQLVFEVQLRIVTGNCGGIAFHWNVILNTGYIFHLCSNGTWDLIRIDSFQPTALVSFASSGAIHQGTGSTIVNTLAAKMIGNTISLFIKRIPIGTWQDNTYLSSGVFALTNNDVTSDTQCWFSQARAWEL